MRFPARFEPAEEGGYVVTFRDIPEAMTQGEDDQDAMVMAEDVLISAMDFYFDDRRPVPAPSKLQPGEKYVELPASVSAKVILLNEMLKQKVTNTELARRLDTTPQEVNRIASLKHSTKIDTLSNALKVLGKRLELKAV